MTEELTRSGSSNLVIERYARLYKEFAAIPCPESEFNYCVKQLQGMYASTELAIAMERAQRQLEKHDPWGALDNLRSKVLQIGTQRSTDEQSLSLKAWQKYAMSDYIEQSTSDVQIGIPFGIGALDENCGGMMKQEIYIFTGRTNVGKSFALLNTSWNLLERNFNPVFATREMAVPWQLHRIASRMGQGKYSINDFRSHNLDDEQLRTFEQALDRITSYSGDMYFIPPNLSACCAQIDAELVKISQEMSIDAIFIDYLNELRPSIDMHGTSSMDVYAQTQVAAEMKDLAIKWNCPVVTCCQDNRTAAGEAAELAGTEGIALSDFIGNKCGLCLRMYQTPIDLAERMITMKSIKQRHDRHFTVRVPERFEYGLLGSWGESQGFTGLSATGGFGRV